jgi:hypothetical protein
VFLTGYIPGHAQNVEVLLYSGCRVISPSNSIYQGDAIVRAFEPMLPNLAIGGAVVPRLRRFHTWELEDDRTFRGGSFEVFVQAVECENLDLVSGYGRRDLL